MSSKQRSSDPREVDRLLASGQASEAARVCRQWAQREPNNPYPWSGLARANMTLGFFGEARVASERLLALQPMDVRIQYVLAISEHNTGRSDAAIERLRRLAEGRTALSEDAAFALATVLEQSGRVDEFIAYVRAGGPWLRADRAVALEAMCVAHEDRKAAIELALRAARSGSSPGVRRDAAFTAVQMLDADGRYAEAFAVARAAHADSTGPFDLGPMKLEMEAQRRAIDAIAARRSTDSGLQPSGAGAAIDNVLFILAAPRSGTTLLEQMLDRHSLVSGIGEYEGCLHIRRDADAMGIGLERLAAMLPADAERLRRQYLSEARARARPGSRWMIDKTLHAWRSLPWIARTLPSARYVHLERDPRDRAISMYLSNFHPRNWAFTSSLDAIRSFTGASRVVIEHATAALGLPAIRMQYEQLVDSPEDEIRRVLDHLGLEFEPEVLEPEGNRRTILTLSVHQVRRKINRSSIGRWKNYAFAFGPEWDALAGG